MKTAAMILAAGKPTNGKIPRPLISQYDANALQPWPYAG